jgi:uncharacterized protein YecE (DUF72 family)
MSRKKYYQVLDAVELQDTFYNPPSIDRMKTLRSEAPNDFTFTMKAWQAITHHPSSRTWRRCKVKIPKELWDRYGNLKPTKENFEAWENIREAAEELNAAVVVIQTPPSFGYTPENFKNIVDFFSSIFPTSFYIGWEPRGSWREHPQKVKEIIDRFKQLIHIVDPFRWKPVSTKFITYFRLHGIGGKEVNYRYRYSDEDLMRLKSIITEFKESDRIFVMFNNISMRDDALRFKEMLRR